MNFLVNFGPKGAKLKAADAEAFRFCEAHRLRPEALPLRTIFGGNHPLTEEDSVIALFCLWL